MVASHEITTTKKITGPVTSFTRHVTRMRKHWRGTNLLFGVALVGECAVTFLPQELPGTEEGLGMLELPSLHCTQE